MRTKKPASIQEEIGQAKPFKSKRQEALVALLRTTDAVRRHLSEKLSPYDITPQQYNVLRILRGAGKGGLPTLTIADRMLERTPGVTRLLDRLEARAWAQRRRCDQDRRRVFCSITAEGLALLAELDPVTEAADETALAGLEGDVLERFVDTLAFIRAGLGREG